MSVHHRDWNKGRSFDCGDFSRADLARRRASVSVCVPTLDEAESIARTLAPLLDLLDEGLVDQVAVVDSGSTDGTQAIVERLGAELHDARALVPGTGPLLGKGDALWRAQGVLHGAIVCFVDADSEDFGEHFVTGLVGPLLTIPDVQFVKALYRRPFKVGDVQLPAGGGRVTELSARPLLNAFYPELAVFGQPLAGEIAARRSLLLRLPFDTRYAIETGMLIDAWWQVGLEGMAQVNLGTRQNRHRPLAQLTPMAATVLQSVLMRLRRDGRLTGTTSSRLLAEPLAGGEGTDVRIVQRPPFASLGADEKQPWARAAVDY
jgi:glucosyl-3-phosphoglycerate synthase